MLLRIFHPGYVLLFAAVLLCVPRVQAAQPDQPETSDITVMQTFSAQEIEVGEAVRISDTRKHIILFAMGIALLVFLLLTAILGIAMGVYGKQVFVPHMLLAGFSVTLAIAHSVVAIVWFNPF